MLNGKTANCLLRHSVQRCVKSRRQEMKWGGAFVKSGPFPLARRQGVRWVRMPVFLDAGLIFYFTFYLFGVHTHPTHPLPMGVVGYVSLCACAKSRDLLKLP